MQQPPPPVPPPLPPAPPQDKPKDGIPYIGSRISLISKTDIRYEGFLFNIDTRQSMVALQNVRSFGTEGRRAEHIPPSNQVLQFAAFKASEIKDLHVCEAAPPVQPPMPPAPYGAYPPQPLQQVQQQQQQQQQQPPLPPQPRASVQPPMPPMQPRSPLKPKPAQTTPTLLTPGSVSSAHMASQPQPHVAAAAPQQQQQAPTLSPQEQYAQYEQRANAILAQQTNYNESRRQQQHSNDSARTIPGMGGHLLKRKERRVPGSGSGTGGGANGSEHESSATAAAAQDFDFEARLTAFNKEEEFSKLSTEQPKTHYQKSSFFDTISCDALDRLEGHKGRMTGFEERKLNAETFGAVSLNGRRNFRGNRGGGSGGGGGRGGGRGGNRRRGRGGGGGGGGQSSGGMNA